MLREGHAWTFVSIHNISHIASSSSVAYHTRLRHLGVIERSRREFCKASKSPNRMLSSACYVKIDSDSTIRAFDGQAVLVAEPVVKLCMQRKPKFWERRKMLVPSARGRGEVVIDRTAALRSRCGVKGRPAAARLRDETRYTNEVVVQKLFWRNLEEWPSKRKSRSWTGVVVYQRS